MRRKKMTHLIAALLCGAFVFGAAEPVLAAAPAGDAAMVSPASGWTRFRDSLLGRHKHHHHHHHRPSFHDRRHHHHRAVSDDGPLATGALPG